MYEPENETKQTESTEAWTAGQDASHSEAPSPLRTIRKIALAGVGALAIATEVSDEVFSELVKRGDKAREEAVRELREARERNRARRSEASGYFRSQMDAIFNRVNLPSKGDVDSINAKLNILSRKMDEVQVSQAENAGGSNGTPEAASGGDDR